MKKSPLTAVLLSAVVPGAGQIYTQSYWKAPVIWGITGWLIYGWIWNNNYYKQNQNYFRLTNDSRYINVIQFYQDQRDLFAIYIGLTYLLNLVDAYVDAQLFDFNVSKIPGTSTTMLNMRIHF